MLRNIRNLEKSLYFRYSALLLQSRLQNCNKNRYFELYIRKHSFLVE